MKPAVETSTVRDLRCHAAHPAPRAAEQADSQAEPAAAKPMPALAAAQPGSVNAPNAGPIERPEAAPLAARVRALEQRYREIAATRMAGVALCHPGLAVTAIDFAPDADGAGALGALVTPWFMNLVWLPLPRTRDTSAPPPAALRVGETRRRAVGPEIFEFIGAHEAGFGDFEACSLFSPMFEFADQAAAVETARQVLRLLREPPARPDAAVEAPRPEAAPGSLPPPSRPAAPPRRAFLFGRGA